MSSKGDALKEKIILETESQVAILGERGANTRVILEKVGTANSGAVQYHFGSKNALVEAVWAYRSKVVNEYCAAYLEALKSAVPNQDLSLSHLVSAVLAPHAYVIRHALPESYYAAFVCKNGGFAPGASERDVDYPWYGPLHDCWQAIDERLAATLPESVLQQRRRAALHYTGNAWLMIEQRCCELARRFPNETQLVVSQLQDFVIRLSNCVSASLLREEFTPLPANISESLERAAEALGEPDWFIGSAGDYGH